MTGGRRISKLHAMYRGEMAAGEHVLPFGDVTHVMGVINVSPESKNPHTIAVNPDEALALAGRYRDWGADLIDVGGQSSHFDNPTLEADEEIERVVPVVSALTESGFIVSVDTWKPAVAEAAVKAGAAIVNDTGGLATSEMRQLVAATGCGVVAVHVDGDHPHDVGAVSLGADKAARIAEGFRLLMGELEPYVAERLILDPGIAINYRGNYEEYTRLQLDVIRNSAVFAPLGRPWLVPIPRKRDIHWVSAYITLALEHRADIIRVHDVAVAAGLVDLWDRKVAR